MIRPRAAILGLLAVAGVQAGCAAHEEESTVRYVALGDSYTIGTSVTEAERWPNQLVERVEQLELAGNPAVNGYTSLDLINDELPALDVLQPELVSVLIGVNDVVQGVPDSQYAGNVAVIMEELLTRLPAGTHPVHRDARLHRHAERGGLRRSGSAERRDRQSQRDHA